jgi:NADH-quinone oxidoreductase subunit K
MNDITMSGGLIISTVFFVIGLAGVLTRKNLLFILMSVEIMLNAAGFAFIVAGAHLGSQEGQVMFIFILAVAAAEVSVGLALVILVFKRFGNLEIDNLKELNG